MTKSLDKVLQSDGSYKWEMVEFQPDVAVEATTETKKKVSKKKTTSPLSD